MVPCTGPWQDPVLLIVFGVMSPVMSVPWCLVAQSFGWARAGFTRRMISRSIYKRGAYHLALGSVIFSLCYNL